MPLSYEAAQQLILAQIHPLAAETVPLLDALGRAIAVAVIAPFDLPHFDNSAMDGYALRAADSGPGKTLTVSGYLAAGSTEQPSVLPGCAVRIMTGAPLPTGADTVVPIEETDSAGTTVTLRGTLPPGQHIRRRGEDVRSGAEVLSVGTILRPAAISMLASLGQMSIAVHRRPRVAILSTGDELIELGEPLTAGRIINSNSWSLAALVLELGGVPVQLGIASDDRESLRAKLSAGLDCDLLITSAGVSAGDRDLVREILEELGAEQLFWKVDIKPGRPLAFAIKEGVPIFSLPGNPVSTMITFEEFVRPALLKLMGQRQLLKPLVHATLQEAMRKKPGRVQLLRVTVQAGAGGLVVASSGDQNTGILRTSLHANGIAVLPFEHGDYAAGETIPVHLLGRDAEWLQGVDAEKTRRECKVVSFIARSGTGKTTLLEQVIAELKRRGYKVGAIKHDAHRFEIDHPGKDSYRFSAAGADTMLISSSSKLALVKQHPAAPPIEELLATYFGDVDIVLTEGLKKSALPKIEVHRAAHGSTLLCRGEQHDPTLLAVASDEPLELDVPILDLNNPLAIADFIEVRLLRP